uniref:uncharacterized protein LOC113182854 n=1 Tax=Urocitellus parryii TaxID=9999 RepID=UPI000E559E44|nr:uncharacterized protein LOC113182854 [Urocitellus parryii]
MARPPRTLLLPPAPALRSCERCRRASLGPAKYRHQVRPAWDPVWRLGEGAQTFVSPETPPAPLAAVAGGGGVPGPEPGCGVPTLRLLRQTGRGSPGAEEGVRAPELPLWVSGARVSGCALGPLPEALQGRGPLQSQLPLPSTGVGGALGGGGARAQTAPPSLAAGKGSASDFQPRVCGPRKNVEMRGCCRAHFLAGGARVISCMDCTNPEVTQQQPLQP